MTESQLQAIENRLEQGDRGFAEMRSDMTALKEEVASLKSSIEAQAGDLKVIREIVVYWNNIQGFAVVMRAIWTVCKWIAAIGSIFAAVYIFGKTGVWRSP